MYKITLRKIVFHVIIDIVKDGGFTLMNKKEINEIKKNFSDDCGFLRSITLFRLLLTQRRILNLNLTSFIIQCLRTNLSL